MTTAPTPAYGSHRPHLPLPAHPLVWLGALLLACGMLLLVHGGATRERAAAAPVVALRPCTLGGARAECGTLSVAPNPADPDEAHIALDVAVVRARSADGRSPSRCSGSPGAAPASATTLRASSQPSRA